MHSHDVNTWNAMFIDPILCTSESRYDALSEPSLGSESSKHTIQHRSMVHAVVSLKSELTANNSVRQQRHERNQRKSVDCCEPF